MGPSISAPARTQSHLQFNPSMFERLRQITKDCRKNFSPTPKPNGSKLSISAGKANGDTPEKSKSTSAPADSSDFVISSAGSSPAHSPQPMDFEVLSTPPLPSKPKSANFEVLGTPPRSSGRKPMDFEVLSTPPRTSKAMESETNQAVTTVHSSSDDHQKGRSRLEERFVESSSKRTLSNGVLANSKTTEKDSPSIEVLEEGDQTAFVGSVAKAAHAVNGEVSSPAARRDISHFSSKKQNSPALSDEEPRVNAEESRGFNLSSDDFRELIRKVIEERMKQIERSMGRESTEKLTLLEKENKSLREYAKRLEASVKKAAESEQTKERVSRAVQTQDPNWLTNLRPRTVAPAPPQNSVTVTRPSSMGLTLNTTPTPRLTSTVAPLPGHTVPSRIENTPGSYRPLRPQAPQVDSVRPRIPSSSNMSPRAQPPGVTYVPNYDPGSVGRSAPSQPVGLRASLVTNFSNSTHPRFNTSPTAQPVMRMQGPIVSPGGPRSIAPTSSRPLPTVTVHPQTQTPSSATSVRVQQDPQAHGYSAQNVYNGGQPGPRFTVAPQMRSQRPPHPQNATTQLSPGPRTPSFPQTSIQASPPQRIIQQLTQQPRPTVPIRASPPVQIQASPHAINQPRPQQPQLSDASYYQQVPRPPRQTTPTQPPPNYGAVAVRAPPPQQAGIPPNPPPVARASPTVHGKDAPPKPSVSIAVVTSGIVLSWNMMLEGRHAPIMNYQLFALQDGGTPENGHQWKKIGVVKALPLPMACTLTQFLPGNKYHFAVRATDETGRLGPFSDPCTITLK